MIIDHKIYFDNLNNALKRVTASKSNGQELILKSAFEKTIKMILKARDSGNKLVFVGNGASAAISSHMAVDFWKNAGVKATAFNDSSLLTCLSNDVGYQYVFEKPIEMFVNQGDVLIAISSSGQSENIIRGANMAKIKKAKVITLSGFKKNNPLRKLGDVNFYVPFSGYGIVEPVHHSICHFLVDSIAKKNGQIQN
ncbi:SIS domain-containing protein [Candidatus Omnitrophota bacterium]